VRGLDGLWNDDTSELGLLAFGVLGRSHMGNRNAARLVMMCFGGLQRRLENSMHVMRE
jgi:hypothetical protein